MKTDRIRNLHRSSIRSSNSTIRLNNSIIHLNNSTRPSSSIIHHNNRVINRKPLSKHRFAGATELATQVSFYPS